jgi:signal transduction histidine kinase
MAEDAGLAHDVGNLLGALRLYSDLLALPGVLREEHRTYAAELRLLSERSGAMVDRLVHHARDRRPEWDDAGGTLLPEVVEQCRGLLGKVAGRAVEVSYSDGAFEPVSVPVESVERILTNLVKNAAEASPRMGTIAVSVEAVVGGDARRRVVLTVRDRGRGMDAAAVRRLMQADGGVTASGRGLGFRVVRELVAMSGGCLNIESLVGVGTSVSAEWYAREGFDFQAQGAGTAMQRDARARAC